MGAPSFSEEAPVLVRGEYVQYKSKEGETWSFVWNLGNLAACQHFDFSDILY